MQVEFKPISVVLIRHKPFKHLFFLEPLAKFIRPSIIVHIYISYASDLCVNTDK